MKIKVKLSKGNTTKKIDVDKGSTIETMLKKLNLNPETLLVMRNNQPAPVDEELEDNDELKVMQVSSGG